MKDRMLQEMYGLNDWQAIVFRELENLVKRVEHQIEHGYAVDCDELLVSFARKYAHPEEVMGRARKVLEVAEVLRRHNLGWMEPPGGNPPLNRTPVYFCLCGGLEDASFEIALKHQAEQIIAALQG